MYMPVTIFGLPGTPLDVVQLLLDYRNLSVVSLRAGDPALRMADGARCRSSACLLGLSKSCPKRQSICVMSWDGSAGLALSVGGMGAARLMTKLESNPRSSRRLAGGLQMQSCATPRRRSPRTSCKRPS